MNRPPVREVTPDEAQALISRGAALLDTREQHEWRTGHLAGATLLPPIEVAQRVEGVVPDKGQTVVIYCAAGARSLRAAFQLAQLDRHVVLENLGIEISPARLKCALLSLQTLRAALGDRVAWQGATDDT